ncbi:efflux RND transporter periplasmic adaptor subunit [Phaeocystidibacter marisrubri]|uniref:Efflux RND transporter periplasmic adaptor subunit n=1 Tax=Phaeocystidibacter marisrubri TaxID=1577780 RepID=A0A6L3ZFW0_9FLAO|nr:efflux RND transporter periplasmic adaptor subunit [Phaeocystidibacter marisrubri]KAB2816368.1 efflux RND transporter periplasmic adaptor subunit [Phaeocystidibacter marisrubri]GGH68698.1 hemolysin D [Phaeocystidibacter marisrubri]
MKSKFLYIALVLFAASCGESESPETMMEDQGHSHSAEFKTGMPTKDTVYSIIQCTGVVDVPPQSRATVSAPLGGYLREVRFYPGERVNKGDVLARIAHPDYVELQRTYLDSKAKTAFYEADLDRKRELYESQAINERALQEVVSQYEVQKSTMMAAAASLLQMGINPNDLTAETIQSELILRSPITGHITHIDGNLGQHVTPEDLIYEIVDDTHMHIELSVFPRDIQGVREGQSIRFMLPGDPTIYKGDIQQVGRQVRPESGAFIIHAHPEEAIEALRPGQYVDGEIIIAPHVGMVLPQSAVVSKGDENFVFEVVDGEYRQRAVRTGVVINGNVEILDSLEFPVVLEKAHLLMDAAGGHTH